MKERLFRYRWSRTFDDKPENYACTDGEVKVGQVYLVNSIADGGWYWLCYAIVGNRSWASYGQVSTRDDACDLVEKAYDHLKARVAEAG